MDSDTAIAIAALVTSVVVAVVTLVRTDKLAARSDEIQSRLASIEEGRRHDEREPTITASFARKRGQPMVTLLNVGPGDLDTVAVTVVVKPPLLEGLRFEEEHPGEPTLEGELGPLRRGEPRHLRAKDAAAGSGGDLTLRLKCRQADHEWDVVTSCFYSGIARARSAGFLRYRDVKRPSQRSN